LGQPRCETASGGSKNLLHSVIRHSVPPRRIFDIDSGIRVSEFWL
jgi:hypothetical protein